MEDQGGQPSGGVDLGKHAMLLDSHLAVQFEKDAVFKSDIV